MINHNTIFLGFADIYLQGADALQPIVTAPGSMTYYLGCPASKILIQDHRLSATKSAQLALNGIEEDKFADVFNDLPHIVVPHSKIDSLADFEEQAPAQKLVLAACN